MGRLFGTDGVRGLANRDLTAELALDLAVAAAHVLGEAGSFTGHRPVAVVATDGRASGEFLSAAVVAGLASAGVDVRPVGALPTPAAAFLTAAMDADLGVMLSASHNPMPDNGIKFFSRGGHKLADHLEDAITDRMREPWDRPTGRNVGRVTPARDTAVQRYIDHLLEAVTTRLDGITVVVDCANGAASHVAPQAYAAAGATVVPIACEPDGWNINDGVGSNHVEVVQKAVLEHGADIGLAHDGDADRCVAVSADGVVVDGDAILAVLALSLRDAGRLVNDTVVTTVMTNLGFRHAMTEHGIAVQETPVGDRYVLEVLRSGGFSLGGEQSGHVIALDHATTGDGLLTGLMLMARMATTGRSLADLASVMTRLPQVLVNVPVADRDRAMDSGDLLAAVAHAEAELAGTGRVLVRPSGTEQLVRVMVEAATSVQADEIARRVAQHCR